MTERTNETMQKVIDTSHIKTAAEVAREAGLLVQAERDEKTFEDYANMVAWGASLLRCVNYGMDYVAEREIMNALYGICQYFDNLEEELVARAEECEYGQNT